MRISRSRVMYGVLAFVVLGVASAGAVEAQERVNWTVTPTFGVLDWDFANENFPMAAVRFDRPISKWVRFEAETSLARVEVQELDGFFDPNGEVEKGSLAALTIGFQLRYRTEHVEPYAGLAFGLFGRRDDDEEGVRSNQSTYSFPAGLRVFLNDKIGLRAEVRLRRDKAVFAADRETNWEQTLGVSYTFGG